MFALSLSTRFRLALSITYHMIYVNIIILPKLAQNQNTEHWHLFYNGLQSIVKHFTAPSSVSGSGLLGVIEKDRDQSRLHHAFTPSTYVAHQITKPGPNHMTRCTLIIYIATTKCKTVVRCAVKYCSCGKFILQNHDNSVRNNVCFLS